METTVHRSSATDITRWFWRANDGSESIGMTRDRMLELRLSIYSFPLAIIIHHLAAPLIKYF